MPIPKCAPTEVYHKASKKCVEVGGENYKSIVAKNANTFKSYIKKIEKIMKKKNHTCTKPNQVYSKKSKKCITINGSVYKKQLKENPKAFNNYMKVANIQVSTPMKNVSNIQVKKKVSTPVKNVSNIQVKKFDICNKDEVFNFFSTRCVKIGGQAYKNALKKDPSVFDDFKEKIKMFQSQQKLLKPVSEKKKPTIKIQKPATLLKRLPPVKVSRPAKQIFMKKAKKILRDADDKSRNALKQTDTLKIPKYMLIKKFTEINFYYFNYFPTEAAVTQETFKEKKNLKRQLINIKFYRDNISSYFYRYILKSNMNPDIIDVDWFINMQSYIKSLSDRQRYALWSYTKHGDVYVNLMERDLYVDTNRIVMNPLFYEIIVYLANPNNSRVHVFTDTIGTVPISLKSIQQAPPDVFKKYIDDKTGVSLHKMFAIFSNDMKSTFFTRHFLLKMIKSLADTISSTIRKAPPTRKPMVVFRGVKDSFFTADNFTSKPKLNEVYYNKGFVSTSLQHTVAINTFASVHTGCCFKVITVLPGTRCIPLIGLTHYSGELEILFDRNVKFIIRDNYKAEIPRRAKMNILNDGDILKMKISDIIIG